MLTAVVLQQQSFFGRLEFGSGNKNEEKYLPLIQKIDYAAMETTGIYQSFEEVKVPKIY